MELIGQVQALDARVPRLCPVLQTEEATKNALVAPLTVPALLRGEVRASLDYIRDYLRPFECPLSAATAVPAFGPGSANESDS